MHYAFLKRKFSKFPRWSSTPAKPTMAMDDTSVIVDTSFFFLQPNMIDAASSHEPLKAQGTDKITMILLWWSMPTKGQHLSRGVCAGRHVALL